MQPYLIDTHAHIYLPEFDDDRSVIISNAELVAVRAIYLPAIDASTHAAMLQTEAQYPICKSMMGLHPCSVNQAYGQELSIIKEHLKTRKFIAIGEIGLDFYWDKTFVNEQYTAFHEQIMIAIEYGLPIAIHSRNATDECIDVIEQYHALKGVFHCFSGDELQAQRIISAGFMLGIGGVLTFKNSGLNKVVEKIGLANLVLETDSPYLAPVPNRGKRNEPAYIKLVAERIASILDKSLEEVMIVTTANAEKLFTITENH